MIVRGQNSSNEIPWVNQIRHLNTSLNDKNGCRMKISSFYVYVNKLNSKFGHLNTTVLFRLFNSYCCAFYGYQNWCLDSIYFNHVLIAWNTGVRRMLHLLNSTNTCILDPLLGTYIYVINLNLEPFAF